MILSQDLKKCPKYGRRFTELSAKIESERQKAQNLVSNAESEKRDINAIEDKLISQHMEKIQELTGEVEKLERQRSFDDSVSHSDFGSMSRPEEGQFIRNEGRAIKDAQGSILARVYDRGENVVRQSDVHESALGQFALCCYQGDFQPMKAHGIKNALSTSSNVDGGVLVPSELSSLLVDLARANSVLFRSGAKLMDVAAGSLTLATVTSDPVFTTTGENEQITASDITFGSKLLNLRKRATIVRVSRELLEDAANAAEIITNVLVRAYASDLDSFLINGESDPFFAGLISDGNISETGSVGGITWEDVSGEITTLKSNNENPNAYIVNPVIAGDLDELVTGDGSTSAKGWLGPPPTLDGVSRFVTSSMPPANIVMGDFSQLAIGMKSNQFRLEISADDRFDFDQVSIRLVYRCDHAVLRSTALRRLAGITT